LHSKITPYSWKYTHSLYRLALFRGKKLFGFGRLSDFLTAEFLPFLILAGGLCFGLVVLFLSGVTRQRRLLSARRGEDVESFVLYLASFGFDAGISRSTYEYLVSEEAVVFPVHHTDRLDRDLHISDDEVSRMVDNLLRINDRVAVPGIRPVFFVTVEDVLRHIQASPMASTGYSTGQYLVRESGIRRAV